MGLLQHHLASRDGPREDQNALEPLGTSLLTVLCTDKENRPDACLVGRAEATGFEAAIAILTGPLAGLPLCRLPASSGSATDPYMDT